MFKKILIANRGEIACRVMRSAQRLGIHCVAVYSSADADSLHVRQSDSAIAIGDAPASESYLCADKIIQAVKDSGAEAVHPGYGFLSESADFCKSLQDSGIVFIGPNVDAIDKMGDKIQSKLLAERAGVNTIPGHPDAVYDSDEAVRIARSIGYPVMLKASAGGGGKGMRLANSDDEVRAGLASAMREAKSSFGDDRVLIEKFISEPRHIEIQILADRHGNTLYLGERECSLQRRHQKVIEEAPSPHLDKATRKRMGEQAVKLARAVDYCSAGTVEFVVDKDRNFYFLEMNTRLQVEHPITEYITGLDLVEWMLRIAAGESLSLRQKDIKLKGWAMEARIYAEDPRSGFLPSIGRLQTLLPPPSSDVVRVDTGVFEGSQISVFYDPMIAKLVTYGKDRPTAIANMRLALDQYVIEGVSHNILFLSHILDNEKFNNGELSTSFIGEYYPQGLSDELITPKTPFAHLAIAAVAYTVIENGNNGEQNKRHLMAFSDDKRRSETPIQITDSGEGTFTILCGSGKKAQQFQIHSNYHRRAKLIQGQLNGDNFSSRISEHQHVYHVEYHGYATAHYLFPQRIAPYFRLMPHKATADLSQFLLSPMPGILNALHVKPGDNVKTGQPLVTIEAMKMENVLKAEKDAIIDEIFAETGISLMIDDKILSFK